VLYLDFIIIVAGHDKTEGITIYDSNQGL